MENDIRINKLRVYNEKTTVLEGRTNYLLVGKCLSLTSRLADKWSPDTRKSIRYHQAYRHVCSM